MGGRGRGRLRGWKRGLQPPQGRLSTLLMSCPAPPPFPPAVQVHPRLGLQWGLQRCLWKFLIRWSIFLGLRGRWGLLLGRDTTVSRVRAALVSGLSGCPRADRFYWTHGYVLISKEAEDCVPMFLSHIAHDVYVCGKTINLLKLCCPQVRGSAGLSAA